MEVILKREIAEKIGLKEWVPFGISVSSWKSSFRETEDRALNLAKMPPELFGKFKTLLAQHKAVRGVSIILSDLAQHEQAMAVGSAKLKARSVRQFAALAKEWLLQVPGQRLYIRRGDCMLAYYVNSVTYEPPDPRQETPPTVQVGLLYEAYGYRQQSSIRFGTEVVHQPIASAFAVKGYAPETDNMRADYLSSHAVYQDVSPAVGRQFLARGEGIEWGESEWKAIRAPLSRDGARSKVVVDIPHEGDEHRGQSDSAEINYFFWLNVASDSSYDPDSDENYDDEDEDSYSRSRKKKARLDENNTERPDIQLPVHPWVIVFDLARHLRIRVHVDQLERYVYDLAIAEKLVLPDEQKQLVKLLIETKGGAFHDIVGGKGAGSVVLLAGPPGVGKTLTAEVYAESEERPLYSVQCSQLGIDPENLETELMTVFTRAKRWDAVMLLDEADVYVRERGGSLQQNAIVGVFLRVLEYQDTVLFLTTNRPEDVDDAIASRCIARLTYAPPAVNEAEKIWRVLATVAGVDIPDAVIASVVAHNPEMTGRDIKNILKLARLMPGADDGITEAMIDYVQQFKPTGKAAQRRLKPGEAADAVRAHLRTGVPA